MYDELTAEREKSISINMPGLMKDVYAWMAIALVVTGFSAWFVSDNALLRGLFMGSRTGTLVLVLATFALVWRLSSAMGKMSLKTAAVMFLVYSVLNGITLSAVFLTYTLSSIGGVFFMTAGTFGIMSVYGYVTKADLSKMGNMCLMGLFGIILATVVGFFFDSTLLQMLISYAGILVSRASPFTTPSPLNGWPLPTIPGPPMKGRRWPSWAPSPCTWISLTFSFTSSASSETGNKTKKAWSFGFTLF